MTIIGTMIYKIVCSCVKEVFLRFTTFLILVYSTKGQQWQHKAHQPMEPSCTEKSFSGCLINLIAF